ncbi:MAG: hypothetical protein R3C27_14255 [Hyphomonadaceae bacterium]
MAEPLKATFFAFQKRERGGLIWGATALYVVLTTALLGGFAYLNWNAIGASFYWIASLGELSDPRQAPPPPPEFFPLLGGYLLILFPVYLVLAAYEAACLRWMLRGETGGVLGFTLGADTWRCYGGYWVWFFLGLASSIVISLIAALIAPAVWAEGATRDQRELLELPFQFVSLYFWLRLAPANATSLGVGEFAFFKAWTVTRDRTFALLGSYLVWGLFYIIVVGAVIGAGYFLVWPSLAPLYADGPVTDIAALGRGYAEAFSSVQLMATAGALAAVLVTAVLFLYVAHFGISARAVLSALEEGKIERATPD